MKTYCIVITLIAFLLVALLIGAIKANQELSAAQFPRRPRPDYSLDVSDTSITISGVFGMTKRIRVAEGCRFTLRDCWFDMRGGDSVAIQTIQKRGKKK